MSGYANLRTLMKAIARNDGQAIPLMYSPVTSRSYSLWVPSHTLPAGVAPTTAAVPTNATGGCFQQRNGGANALRLLGFDGTQSLGQGMIMVADRLSHQGGLSGIVAPGEQTTNLPTAALTRHTDGDKVLIAVEIHTQVGATPANLTARYTDGVNGAGRVTPPIQFGNTGFREANRFIVLPLQAGDKNPVSVQGVTLTVTTGTAGAFGIVLFRPKMFMVLDEEGLARFTQLFCPPLSYGIEMPVIDDGACLWPVALEGSSGASQIMGEYIFREDD